MSAVTGQAQGSPPAQASRRSAPEKAATTPGLASASSRSTERIVAWAYGLRTSTDVQRAGDLQVVDETRLAREQRRVLAPQQARPEDAGPGPGRCRRRRRASGGLDGRHRTGPHELSSGVRAAASAALTMLW